MRITINGSPSTPSPFQYEISSGGFGFFAGAFTSSAFGGGVIAQLERKMSAVAAAALPHFKRKLMRRDASQFLQCVNSRVAGRGGISPASFPAENPRPEEPL